MDLAKHWIRYMAVALLGWLLYTGLFFTLGRLARWAAPALAALIGTPMGGPAAHLGLHRPFMTATSLPACVLAGALAAFIVLYLRWPIDNPLIDYQIERERHTTIRPPL